MVQDRNNKKAITILCVLGVFPVIWLGLSIAPSVNGGIAEIIPKLAEVINNPFNITLCEDSLKTVLTLLLIYAIVVGVIISSLRNYRRGEEHGSAKWGDVKKVNKKYHQTPENNNKIMTQGVAIGLNAKKHRRNLNTLVCGGSGAGKTFFYAKPNLMQCNCSFVTTDPKGEILRNCGQMLKDQGYILRVLDLINMDRSDCYNPFVYLKSDNDVQRMVTNLFKATTPKNSTNNDPFWDNLAQTLLLALVFYLHYEAPEEEKNFAMVMEMIRAGAIEDEEEQSYSPLDMLFYEHERKNHENIEVKYYRK